MVIRRFTFALILLVSPMISQAADSEMIRDISQMQVSEKALNDAVASRTLSWLTGSSSNNDYMSVGRMANYFGFVGLRVASGHSLSRSQVAKHTLAVLDSDQREILIELVTEQKAPFNKAVASRSAMNRALEGLLVGETISEAAFIRLGETYGADEALLGQVIAQRLGEIIQTLDNDQKQQLNQIRDAYLNGKGQDLSLSSSKIKMSKADKKELVNLAARLLSWSTGDQEFNDFEVVGKPSQHFGFVSLRIASNHGIKRGQVAKEVRSLLTEQQNALLQQSAQNNIAEFNDFLEQRGQLMRTLEAAQQGKTISTDKVVEYGQATGGIEASMTWDQAQAMLKVRALLTDSQSQTLLTIRNKYTAGGNDTLPENSIERGRQLYSQCTLCHSENSSIAPNMNQIVGRKVASDDRYQNYSKAMLEFAAKNPVWSESLIEQFLASPKDLIPGTYMGYTGLKNKQDRQAIVEYLSTLD
ncbi:c-type cytochrome [Vibrio hippocampi]|uniref:Cytochrome c domain-containing protein n=1 Tax=Vibrio hippocampi TaxID=654686 RepID=A0ABM8ZNS0_9VIBR|nr:c-type cytochrome [Vibrio hippocampi]CAH0530316.1 hypothetical protein VHP8226_03957 [Vibrio hippocampi]